MDFDIKSIRVLRDLINQYDMEEIEKDAKKEALELVNKIINLAENQKIIIEISDSCDLSISVERNYHTRNLK